MRQTQSISWVVDVPADFLTESTRYSFQFRAASPSDSSGEVSSPQVVVRYAGSAVSSTSISTSSASSTSSAFSTASTSSSPTQSSTITPASVPGEQRSSFPPGAIAGIVIGAAALIAVAVGLFFFRKKRASRVTHGTPQQTHETAMHDPNLYKQEHYGSYNFGAGTPAEVPPHRAELPSYDVRS